jgi:hypothetical protein
MKQDTCRKIHGHFYQVSPALLLGVSAGICQRALVDDQEWLELRWGCTIDRTEMVAVHGIPFMIPSCNSNH